MKQTDIDEAKIRSLQSLLIAQVSAHAGNLRGIDPGELAALVDRSFNILNGKNNLELYLSSEQIKSLSKFAEDEGQAAYKITTGFIPAADDIPEYYGLIVYSDSEKHGVLQLN